MPHQKVRPLCRNAFIVAEWIDLSGYMHGLSFVRFVFFVDELRPLR